MLSVLQLLNFELSTGCNLAHLHEKCPNRHPERFAGLDTSRPLDDDTIVAIATRAYQEFGFCGFVGFVYYNEPLLQAERMFSLIQRIRGNVGLARFLLWTNATLIPQDCWRFSAFEQIHLSWYDGVDLPAVVGRLQRHCSRIHWYDKRTCGLDDRIQELPPPDPTAPCTRPFFELAIDAFGNLHPCCYDWRGRTGLGNVHADNLGSLLVRWESLLGEVCGEQMAADAPDACLRCGHRWSGYQIIDPAITIRAEQWRHLLL